MASSYALPASAITNSHHGHGHGHSHSHSPGRPSANRPRSFREERLNGSLHAYSASDSNLGHIHEHSARSPSPLRIERFPDEREHEHGDEYTHNHGPKGPTTPSPYVSSPYFDVPDMPSPDRSDPFGMMDDLPVNPLPTYQPPAHGHHHVHATTASTAPRSGFTNLILPLVIRWPLLHTIMADKDSRRIFYFMRCVPLSDCRMRVLI